jgi:hypothetical protein
MSGVAKDDINPTPPTEDTVSAVGDAEAGHAESNDASDIEARAARRAAPHLRVVADNVDAEFVAPVVPLIDQPNMRIGAVIKATRENLSYTLDQVSKEIRVHISHLRAIEEMTPNLLGAPVYAKGYIKAYARHLGLDEQMTLDRYLKECAILKDPVKQTIAPPSGGRKLPVAAPVFGFLIVALVGAAGYFLFANGDKTPLTPEVASSAPPPVAPAQQTPPTIGVIAAPSAQAPARTQQLRAVALKRELLEVRSADGTKYVHRYFEPGESYTPRVGSGWTVSTRDGSAFEWRLGDQSLGLFAETGPVNAQNVDTAAQRTPIAPAVTEIPAAEATPAPAPEGAVRPPAATGSQPPAAATTPAAPPKPRSPRPRPAPVEQPPVASAAPATTTTTPGATTTFPATPAQDPALAAYPDQPPPPPPPGQ